ncbi:MAG: GtrA family protein, partial [Pseudomonadota bacterium]
VERVYNDQDAFHQTLQVDTTAEIPGFAVLTTVIFWGTEVAFYWHFGSEEMRELGAVLGLTVGYLIKYQLDRRYVFEVGA